MNPYNDLVILFWFTDNTKLHLKVPKTELHGHQAHSLKYKYKN